ncbi:MAG: Wzz/FepE/Etk N-terminal domain-containing protein [Candidatus Aminicenantales bacterium]
MDQYENEIKLIDLLNVIWKRKWLIIIPTFFCVVIAAAVSFLLPKVWEVDAVMLPSKFFVQTDQGEFAEVVVTDPKQIAGQINQKSYNSLIASELNLDIRKFPRLSAENLRDTKLVRIVIRDEDIARAKSILQSLFNHLKKELDSKIEVETKDLDTQITLKENSIRDMENEIKTKENEIKKKNNEIKLKDLAIQSKEIEKDRIKQEIESDQNKLKISEQRVESIMEEMKSVKGRIDELDKQLNKVISEKKEGSEAVSLLLYSNEIQQNLRYYNTLDEKLSIEKVTQENLRLSSKENGEKIRQTDNQISQMNTEKQIIMTEISTIMNETENIKNKINTTQSEIRLLGDKKSRIDYAQLVKEPTSSLYPVSPRKKMNVLIACVLGVFVFTILAFFLEYIEKQKIKNNKKLEVIKEKNENSPG